MAQGNEWLTYGAPLHRLREWGTSRKVFDLIDERPLDASQMREMVGLIAGGSPSCAARCGTVNHAEGGRVERDFDVLYHQVPS